MKWAVGVTTVPSRREELLPRTLHSLCDAGFTVDRLFVDGTEDPAPYKVFDIPTTVRYPAIKAHGNWVLSIYELFLREPHADRYALFQDDLIACLNVREYLESSLYPEKGYLNLITFSRSVKYLKADTKGWIKSIQKGLGAVGLVFNHAALVALLGHQHLINRVYIPSPKGRPGYPRLVDGGIVESLSTALGYPEYCHIPSLISHTGTKSAITGRMWRADVAPSFPGEGFDAMSLIPKTNS